MQSPGGSKKVQATADPIKVKADTVRAAVQAMLLTGKSASSGTASALSPGATINGVLFTGAAPITITASAPHALTLGSGLSGTSYDGSAAVTATVTGAPWSGITGTPTTLAGYGITSPLNVAQGGTGLATFTAAGGMAYATAASTLAVLAIGAANTVLSSSGTAPQWSANIAYAALPTGSGSWDAGSGNTTTITRALTVGGLLELNGGADLPNAITLSLNTGIVSGTPSVTARFDFTRATPMTFTNVQTVSLQLSTQSVGAASMIVPNLAGVSDTLVFLGLTQTLSNKTLASPEITGTLGIGTAPVTSRGIVTAGTLTGSVTQRGIDIGTVFDSTATTMGVGVHAKLSTAASAFTMTSGYGIQIDAPSIGAGSTVTTVIGLRIENQTGGGTNLAISTGTGACNFGDVLNLTSTVAKYNNVATAGFGVSPIYASGRVTAKTNATSGTVCTYTPAADGTFVIYANVNVTTSTTFSFTVTCTYTDEGGTARTQTFSFAQVGGVPIQTLTNVTGAGTYDGFPLTIRAKGANAITILTAPAGTYTAVVYNISAAIVQLAA